MFLNPFVELKYSLNSSGNYLIYFFLFAFGAIHVHMQKVEFGRTIVDYGLSGLIKASEHELNLSTYACPLKPVDLKQISDLHAEVEDISETM